MKRFFVKTNLSNEKRVKIDGTEHNHIKNVMRLQVGDKIILVCSDDYDYISTIEKIEKSYTECVIESKIKNECNSVSNVTFFQALVKSDNMSLIIQKLTELGVTDLVPFESEFVTSKDKNHKFEKLQKISNQSIKQCRRSKPMTVHNVVKFDEMIKILKDYDKIIFANETEDSQALNSIDFDSSEKIAVVVGSEGGFSESEIEKLKNANAKSITMGKRILRAETASIALASVIMYRLGEWER